MAWWLGSEILLYDCHLLLYIDCGIQLALKLLRSLHEL